MTHKLARRAARYPFLVWMESVPPNILEVYQLDLLRMQQYDLYPLGDFSPKKKKKSFEALYLAFGYRRPLWAHRNLAGPIPKKKNETLKTKHTNSINTKRHRRDSLKLLCYSFFDLFFC